MTNNGLLVSTLLFVLGLVVTLLPEIYKVMLVINAKKTRSNSCKFAGAKACPFNAHLPMLIVALVLVFFDVFDLLDSLAVVDTI